MTLAALLVAGELAGCAGIANPYQTNGTATQHHLHPDEPRRPPTQAIPRQSATEPSQPGSKPRSTASAPAQRGPARRWR